MDGKEIKIISGERTDNGDRKWVSKASSGTELFQQTGNLHDIKLSCECSCIHCKDIYNSYLEEKALCGLLHDALDEEKDSFSDFVEKVKQREESHEAEISEKNATIDRERELYSTINEQLQYERELRLQEAYKLEAAQREIERLQAEASGLNGQLVWRAEDQLNSVEQLDIKTKELRDALAVSSNLNLRLQKYEQEIFLLENANAQLRLQLNGAVDNLHNISVQTLQQQGTINGPKKTFAPSGSISGGSKSSNSYHSKGGDQYSKSRRRESTSSLLLKPL